MPVKKLIAGNWKMNGLRADAAERVSALAQRMTSIQPKDFDMLICPPATLLQDMRTQMQGSGLLLGGQDCHAQEAGAYTGDISPLMLTDMGCTHVIVGHSERRQYHKESSPDVAAKARAAHAAGLTAIICVGESEMEREAGYAQKIVSTQLKESVPDTATAENTVIAYEPVWAIGTGKSATAEDITDMHAFIRGFVADMMANTAWLKLLYGGSVNTGNAPAVLHTPNVDGVLVGGASLKPEDFWSIAMACEDMPTE